MPPPIDVLKLHTQDKWQLTIWYLAISLTLAVWPLLWINLLPDEQNKTLVFLLASTISALILLLAVSSSYFRYSLNSRKEISTLKETFASETSKLKLIHKKELQKLNDEISKNTNETIAKEQKNADKLNSEPEETY